MSWLLIIPLMIVCLFLNIRVYLAMFIGIIAYFLFFSSVPIEIAVQRLIAPTQSPSLLAIPFFILLGTLMSYTGIAERILHIANVLVGKMRGGLGVANILVSTMMGGVSASNLADAAMLSRMMVPEMERKGYNRAFAAAITNDGGLQAGFCRRHYRWWLVSHPDHTAWNSPDYLRSGCRCLYRKNVYRRTGTWFAMRSRTDVYRLPCRPQN